MSGLKEVNLNDYVYVKLTDVGRNELEKQHRELNSMFPNAKFKYNPLKEDENGFVKIQLWCLMSELGHLCVMGLKQPFETTIKLDNKE